MRVLVVEDDRVSRRLLCGLLQPFGTVEEVADGEAAVERVREALEQGRSYDLVCLDILMPRLDGHATLQVLRRMELERGIPVGAGAKVMMTTSLKDSKSVMTAFRNQCETYLVKPIDRARLYQALEELGLSPPG